MEVKILKIKIGALIALCVFLVGIAGMGSASAADSVTTSTYFTNVDLKHGENLALANGQIMAIKGIQDGKDVGIKVDYYYNPISAYEVHIIVNYIDLFGGSSSVDDWFYPDDSDCGHIYDYITAKYMNMSAGTNVTVEISPVEWCC